MRSRKGFGSCMNRVYLILQWNSVLTDAKMSKWFHFMSVTGGFHMISNGWGILVRALNFLSNCLAWVNKDVNYTSLISSCHWMLLLLLWCYVLTLIMRGTKLFSDSRISITVTSIFCFSWIFLALSRTSAMSSLVTDGRSCLCCGMLNSELNTMRKEQNLFRLEWSFTNSTSFSLRQPFALTCSCRISCISRHFQLSSGMHYVRMYQQKAFLKEIMETA